MNISGIEKLTEFSKNDRFLQKQGKKNTKNNGFDEILREEQERVEKELESDSHNNRTTSAIVCNLWSVGKSRNQGHMDTTKPSQSMLPNRSRARDSARVVDGNY